MPLKRPSRKHPLPYSSKSKSASRSPLALSGLSPLKRMTSSKVDFVVNARDVMSVKFIHNASELDSMDGFFSPVYVHQLFSNEKILGYRDLHIRVFFSQPALHCYIELEYTERLLHDDTTDIIAVFRRWIKAGFTQNKQRFINQLAEPFEPFGKLHCQFIRPNTSNHCHPSSTDNDPGQWSETSSSKSESKPSPYRIRSRNTPRSSRRKVDYSPQSSLRRIRNQPKPLATKPLKPQTKPSSSNESSSPTPPPKRTKKRSSQSPRNARLQRRKRRLSLSLSSQATKRRRLNHNTLSTSSDEAYEEKKDCLSPCILHSRFGVGDTVYEIRLGSFEDAGMRSFHVRLQFFVLLFIESSSFLDENDEIWEVLVLYRRRKERYETLGYMTLYKFFAFPESRRLRISQVMMFPPFQRQGLGFEVLQHVHLMTRYRRFVEVNVEDPGEGFQMLRDSCDVYNAWREGVFDRRGFEVVFLTTYHDVLMNAIKERKDGKEGKEGDGSVFGLGGRDEKDGKDGSDDRDDSESTEEEDGVVVVEHGKLSKELYHDAIMRAHRILRITPEQARRAYECLKWEFVDRQNEREWKLYKLDVKRRLYASLGLNQMHSYDESSVYARLTQEFNGATSRYCKILKKRDEWVRRVKDWDKTHEYPLWIVKKLKGFEMGTGKDKKRKRRT